MGYLPIKSDHGADLPFDYLPAAAGSYKVGQLLNISDGKLAAITAACATTPAYLCMAERTVEAGEELPVTRISHDYIYETTLSAAAATATVGTKLQVSKGGLEADGAAAGTFEIVTLEGTAKGDIVRGRWA